MIRKILTFFITIFLLLLLGEGYFRYIGSLEIMQAVPDSEVYWFPKPNQKCRVLLMNGKWSPLITINSFGLRGQELRGGLEKNMLFLGDSITFGYGVKDNETIPSFLSFLLNNNSTEKIGVINAGIPGWGIFQMERFLAKNIHILKPIIVILIYTQGNEDRQPFEGQKLKDFFKKQTSLKSKIIDNSSFLSWIVNIWRLFKRKFYLVKTHIMKKGETLTERKSENLILKDTVRLQAIKRMCDENNIKFLLVRWLRDNRLLSLSETDLADFAKRENISLLFVGNPNFFNSYSSEELLIKGDWHPSPLAYKLAAQLIYNKLYDLGWLPTNKQNNYRIPR